MIITNRNPPFCPVVQHPRSFLDYIVARIVTALNSTHSQRQMIKVVELNACAPYH